MRGPLAETGIRGKRQLRFLTCGSVDDGKSTLIGRLLHDTGCVTEDQRAALTKDSARFGTVGADLDFALLTDGLEDERQQGITIDVAFRYFSTRADRSSSPIPRVMNSIRAIWRPARRTRS
jgi:bifunctional enzyme CysN/CysC